MKKFYIPIFIIFINFSFTKTDNEILKKVIFNLNDLKNVEYDLVSQDVSKFMDRNRTDSAYCYFDFTSKDTIIGVKYQFISKDGELVFDGKSMFHSINREEHVLYTNQPKKREVVSNVYMLNSLFELKEVLPKIILDSSVHITRKKDTSINNKECYQFNISMTGKFIGMGGELTKVSEKETATLNYLLSVSKKTYLPVQFTLTYPNGQGFRTSTFNNLKHVKPKNDSIWSYERMPQRYMRNTFSDYYQGMRTKNKDKIGKKSSDWSLPMVQGDSIQLSKIKSNLVLLEFWFPYCTGCVQAVPDLNEIHEKYKEKGLKMYGIEFTKKSEKTLIDYIEKQKINFPTLFMGEKASKEYGVYAAPTFFLIDEKGTIIYTSVGLNKEELINQIDDNI